MFAFNNVGKNYFASLNEYRFHTNSYALLFRFVLFALLCSIDVYMEEFCFSLFCNRKHALILLSFPFLCIFVV